MGFFSSSTSHPITTRYPVFDIEATYFLSKKSGISLNVGLADCIDVDGLGIFFIENHGQDTYTLELISKIWTVSLNYVYCSMNKRHYIFIGPSYLIHSLKGEMVDESMAANYSEKLGLYLGYSFQVIQKKKWFLMLNTNYRWAPKTEIGPYIYNNDVYEPYTLALLPVTEIDLTCLNIGLSLGFRIRNK
ncbi:hypothetical protein ACFLSE_07120 [Bacteroidota bacterium]